MSADPYIGRFGVALPVEEGWEWRKTCDQDAWASTRVTRRAKLSIGTESHYYIHTRTEPDWVSIPEGTLCRIGIDTGDAPVTCLAERYGRSFLVMGGDGGTVNPKKILSAKPVRVLGDDEVAVKMVDEPHTDWAVTAAIMKAKGYDEVAELCYAYADALEREGKS